MKTTTILLIVGLLGANLARADAIAITLDAATLAGPAGSGVTFTGSLLNDSGAEMFLNGIGANLSYLELTFDPTPFFDFVPLSLIDGDSYNGPLFSVAISDVAVPGDYSGNVIIQGGLDGATFDTLGSANFQVTVTNIATPEPSSFVDLAAILVALVLLPVYYERRLFSIRG